MLSAVVSVIDDRRPGVVRAVPQQLPAGTGQPATDRRRPHKSTSELLLGLPPAEPLNICADELTSIIAFRHLIHCSHDQRSDGLIKHRTTEFLPLLPRNDFNVRSKTAESSHFVDYWTVYPIFMPMCFLLVLLSSIFRLFSCARKHIGIKIG